MKRKLITCLMLAAVLLSVFAFPTTVSAEEKNMLKNGNFSSKSSNWTLWTQDPDNASSKAVMGAGPNGSNCMKIQNTQAVATSLYQYADCEPGKTYIMTCDVKLENVEGGSGVCLGMTTYDKSMNNMGETISTSLFGTTDWRTLTFIFKITNDAAKVTVGPRLWFASGTVYVDNVTLVEVTETEAVSATYDVTLSDTANRHTVNALGCEWDPKLLLPVNKDHGVIDDDLDTIKQAMQTLGLQAVRMMVTPDWFEPENDNDDPKVMDPDGFSWDGNEIQCLFAYLKVCEELGVRVTLTWWGAPAGHWLAYPNIGDWIGAPNDPDEMAENIGALLQYIRNTLGYSCVKELIIQNEPSYSFHVEGGAVDAELYVTCYKTMRKWLDDAGMEDIVLVGADDSQSLGWFNQVVPELKDVCGKFNSHNYAWSYDLPYLDLLAQEFVEARTDLADDIPFYLGEFGDGSTVGAYYASSTETYGRGLYVASIVTNAFKAGAAGASYWPLHDVYYYQGSVEPGTGEADNGGLMGMGLIGYKKDGAWSYRPTYYAYGLLCNYIPYGSEIYDISGDTDHLVDTVAAKTPDGRWSLIAVNRSGAEQTVRINTGSAVGSQLNRYLFAEDALPTDGSMIASSGTVAPTDGVYSVTLPAYSFAVLSNIGMSDDEMALPEALPETQPETQPDTQPETQSETQPNTQPETVPDTTPETTDATATISETATDTEPAGGSGCASTLGAGGCAVLLAGAAATGIVRRKRRKKQ